MARKQDPHTQNVRTPRPEGKDAGFAKKKVGAGLDEFVISEKGERTRKDPDMRKDPGPYSPAQQKAEVIPEAELVPTVARNHYMPDYDPDVVTGGQPDLLNIDLEVNAMAALVSTREITPPLSIGLFGDWGTGKTFFMDRMHARVARISSAGAAGFCSGVVQIRFNAWHYVEANLWASLIDTIFTRLEQAVLGSDDGDAQLKALRDRWQSALDDQRRAEHELAQVAERLEQARAERDALQKQKQEAELQAKTAREMGKKDLPAVADISEELAGQLGPLLERAGAELGLDRLRADAARIAAKPVDQALRTLDDAHITRDRVLEMWRAFASSGITPKQVVLAMIAMLVPMATVALFAYFHSGIQSIGDWLAQPLTVLAELAAMAGTATQWVRGRIRRANELLDRLDEKRRELTRARDHELEQRQNALQEADARVASLAGELDAKQTEVDALAAREQAARRELDDFSPARRMATFLSERVASDDYRKHLGLIALIRRDLQKLSELLAIQDDEARDSALPGVQRIVLYIDDLDRCSPRRVVELLQAVHLLLAFPLFVVVVAVDARWVSRALVNYYPELLDHAGDQAKQSGQATSHDYLEKIFQIPFWIEPMTATGSSAMLDGLLSGRGRAAEGEGEDEDESQATDIDAARLEIKPEERDALLALAGIAGRSPRAIKRFINVYRLIKATMSATELANFEPDRTRKQEQAPAYAPTMLALAVTIGFPHLADDLFAELAGHSDGVMPLPALVADLQDEYHDQPEWRRLLAGVEQYCRKMSGDAGIEITTAEVAKCAGKVARYSFRIVPR